MRWTFARLSLMRWTYSRLSLTRWTFVCGSLNMFGWPWWYDNLLLSLLGGVAVLLSILNGVLIFLSILYILEFLIILDKVTSSPH